MYLLQSLDKEIDIFQLMISSMVHEIYHAKYNNKNNHYLHLMNKHRWYACVFEKMNIIHQSRLQQYKSYKNKLTSLVNVLAVRKCCQLQPNIKQIKNTQITITEYSLLPTIMIKFVLNGVCGGGR